MDLVPQLRLQMAHGYLGAIVKQEDGILRYPKVWLHVSLIDPAVDLQQTWQLIPIHSAAVTEWDLIGNRHRDYRQLTETAV